MLSMRIVILLLSVLAVATPAVAQRDLCPPYENPVSVKFETRLIPPTYNHDLSVNEVRSLYTVRGQRVSRAHNRAIGLTYAEVSLGLSASTRSVPRERGGYCVYLEEVKADFGFDRFDVYIGREYRRGTCEYRTILDHENEHVAINTNAVKNYGPQLRRSIEQQLSYLPPLFTPNVRTGARLAVQELQDRIKPVMEAFRREQRRRNQAIDTEANYGALQELCLDWALYR